MQTEKLSWFWTGSQSMQEVLSHLKLLASHNIPILIVGETGSGKELIARKLWDFRRDHYSYSTAEAPFIAVNVSTIPENLAESILFGHERGAFTSARERQMGKFEIAKHGTLFLDEIQNMDLSLQCKLLRVIQNRELDRLGSKSSIEVNCQIVAASNIPLEILCQEGRFRKDLYYRLNTFPIYLPPLRKRRHELLQIITSFMHETLPRHRIQPKALSSEVIATLENHSWPGNFRELEHTLIYAHLKCQGDEIQTRDLPPQLSGKTESYLKEGLWN
jgi:DNA-binding NtrC family response regulator